MMPDLVQTHGNFLFCSSFFLFQSFPFFFFFALEFEGGGGDEGRRRKHRKCKEFWNLKCMGKTSNFPESKQKVVAGS